MPADPNRKWELDQPADAPSQDGGRKWQMDNTEYMPGMSQVPGAPPDLGANSIIPTAIGLAKQGYQALADNPAPAAAALGSVMLQGAKRVAPLVGGVAGAAEAGKQAGQLYMEHAHPGTNYDAPPDLSTSLKRIGDQVLGQGLVEKVAQFAGKTLTPARIMESQLGRQDQEVLQNMLERGINPGRGGETKVRGMIDDMNKQVADALAPHGGRLLDRDRALGPILEDRDKALMQSQGIPPAVSAREARGMPAEFADAMDKHIERIQTNHPRFIPIEDVQRIKKGLRGEAGEYGTDLSASPSTRISNQHAMKRTIGGLNDEIVRTTGDPSIAQKFAEQAKLIDIEDVLKAANSAKQGLLPRSISRPLVGAAAGATIGSYEYKKPMDRAMITALGAALGSPTAAGILARRINYAPEAIRQGLMAPARVGASKISPASAITNLWDQYGQ